MRFRKNRSVQMAGFVLLAASFGAFLAIDEQGGIRFTRFRMEKWFRQKFDLHSPVTPAETRQAAIEAEAATKHALAEFPELVVDRRNVPFEENGFLGIFGLKDKEGFQRLLDSGVLENLKKDGIEFDPADIRVDLESHDAIGKAIIAVAKMKQRSSAVFPAIYMEDLGITAKAATDYLLLLARLAAAEGSPKMALRYVSLAVNFTNHLREVESPTLLSETAVVVLEMGIRAALFKWILPDLGISADLSSFKEALGKPDYSPARYAAVLKGEWSFFSEQLASTVFLRGDPALVPDPESFLMAYASVTSANLSLLKPLTSMEFVDRGSTGKASFPEGLSWESREMIDTAAQDNWSRGIFRASAIISQSDAALDLLIRERNGEDLSHLKNSIVENPLTEMPFAYDPVARTLTADGVPEDYRLTPLVLPEP